MSLTFTLTGNSSVLSSQFNPPIYLDEDSSYEIGVANFDTFNSIPNIDERNNVFVFGEKDQHRIEIVPGSYELSHVIEIIKKQVLLQDDTTILLIKSDIHTAKVSIECNRKINFNVANSIGSVLGFEKKILEPDYIHISDNEVKILKVNSICIDCDIAVGSYLNDAPVHIIHQFFPTVPFGYKIVESPLTILYFPVSVKTINSITIKVVDQDNSLINFRKETITLRLHLRKKNL